MSRTQVMGFEDFCKYSAEMIQKKVIGNNDDQVVLCAGYEGTGKSTFSIAYACETYKQMGLKYDKNLIFYQWEDYLYTNLAAMVGQLGQYPQELLDELIENYGIDLSKVYDKLDKYPLVKKGDILVYDEAGTQSFNREAMSGKNVKMAKLMISNRFLNLVHILNCPKPGSIDRYIRSERSRMLIWCDAEYTNFWETRIREVHIYMKSSYQRILGSKYWWEYFNDTKRLIHKFPPDITLDLPEDLTKYIPEDVHTYYLAKKNVFNITQVLGMLDDKEKKDVKADKKDFNKVLPYAWELPLEWSKRTGRSPNSYTQAGGRLKEARKVRQELISKNEIPEGMEIENG